MKEIVKVLLAEGISEEVIHEVLDILEAEYDPENPDVTYHGSVARKAKREADKNWSIMMKSMKSGDLKTEKEAREKYFKNSHREVDAQVAKRKARALAVKKEAENK